jgi:hypothetical protein
MAKKNTPELKFWYAQQLLAEIVKKHESVRAAERRIKFWLCWTLAAVAGLFLLTAFSGNAAGTLILVIITGVSYRKYALYHQRLNHASVNLEILKHHLIAKLELGLCRRRQTAHCDCREHYHHYVWDRYGLSLYEDG